MSEWSEERWINCGACNTLNQTPTCEECGHVTPVALHLQDFERAEAAREQAYLALFPWDISYKERRYLNG